MKIGFCADIHLANHKRWGKPSRGTVAPVNTRAADILSVIRAARRKARQEGVTDLFVLGDVFDTTTPEPQLIAELSRALYDPELTVHIMVGNHDQQSAAPGDHALIALDGCRNVIVYDKPTLVHVADGKCIVHLVPYIPGKATEYLPGVLTALREDVPEVCTAKHVLALHLGLRGEKTEPWMRESHDSYPAPALAGQYDLVAAGNWHGRHEEPEGVWQVGALVPTGFDNPGWTDYGTLLMYDGKRAVAHELPGPRFVKAHGVKELHDQLDSCENWVHDYPVYVSARVVAADRARAVELVELYGWPTVEVLSDREAEQEAARSAVRASKASADDVRAAIASYVDKMSLPDDVDRARVKQLAVDYWAGADG